LRRDFAGICETFAKYNVKQSILTNGLLLEKYIRDVYKYFNEIIVSIDGADAEMHNSIRGVNSFDQIVKGIKSAVALNSPPYPGGTRRSVSIRSVIQKRNFRQVKQMVKHAKSLGVNRISFLSADVEPGSFGRNRTNETLQSEDILLSEEEVKEFRQILNTMFTECKSDFTSGFISESPAKMLRLADYFEAHLGKSDFPENQCNAPMVSAVITSTGEIQPCFFLPSYGNIRKDSVNRLINSDSIKDTRRKLKNYSLERCKTCVCTLCVSSKSALYDRF
jgi:Fe-coproporphyrin III synthase